jgi:hypothetical protein
VICYFINKGEKNEYKIKIYKNNSDIRFEFFGISINFIMIVKLEFILNIILFWIQFFPENEPKEKNEKTTNKKREKLSKEIFFKIMQRKFKTYLDINSFYSSIVIPEVYCKIYSWM